MMKRKRTVKWVEQQTTTVVDFDRGIKGFCVRCGRDSFLTGIEQASVLAGIGVRALWQMIESSAVHIVEPSDGSLLVCLPSLKALIRQAGIAKAGPDVDVREK